MFILASRKCPTVKQYSAYPSCGRIRRRWKQKEKLGFTKKISSIEGHVKNKYVHKTGKKINFNFLTFTQLHFFLVKNSPGALMCVAEKS